MDWIVIRRDITTADGRPGWLHVAQIAHAELAGNLADVWRLEGLRPALRPAEVEVEGDLRTAVHRHDDGWLDWDTRPGVDAKLGLPVNFDEMRLPDSLSIWSRSIESAAARGPLIGYFVAGHFTRLLRRFNSWRNDPALDVFSREFLTRHDAEMDRWRRQEAEPGSPDSGHELADRDRRGVSYLQLFDAISLWLCCAERHEPWRAELSAGEGWTFSPVGGGTPDRQQVRIEPWPLGVTHCDLAVRGWVVPRAHYRSTDELLAATIADDVTIAWRLVP
jgi:hypothetical protein